MASPSYDLAIIGAGPGGYVAAIRAAQLGMRVACIERDRSLGGTCLNVGCIPSKALLDSSERYAEVREHLAEHGIEVETVRLNLDQMMKRKRRVVQMLTKGVAGLFRKNGVDSITGSAAFVSPNRLTITGETSATVTAQRILIATGSRPIELPQAAFDGERILSSTEALELSAVPQHLAVIGAGAIGLELGSVWRRLGSEVTVIEIQPEALPGMDAEVASGLRKALEKQGIRFRLKATLKNATVDGDHVRLTIAGESGDDNLDADRLLVAVGRRALTDGLALGEIGLATDDRGRIPVDEHYRTSVPGVYAIGDVIAGPMLAHKAQEEGIAAVERMAGVAGHVNYQAVPNVVYTWPEAASVGHTREAAERAGHAVRSGSFPFRANGRARCSNEADGFVKIIADASSDAILGIHILGPHASELIGEAAVAMEFSASAEDIARSVHAHPTLAEAIKEAALAVGERGIHF
jgi:dihydrolipoamide dehydrogenase